MKVTIVEFTTTAGNRYGLKNAKTGQLLTYCSSKWKTSRGAINYAKKHGYEIA